MRDLARRFFRINVGNGKDTCFWFDNWSKLGCLREALGDNTIALGISPKDSIADVLVKHRKRRHRIPILNEVEQEIEEIRLRNSSEDDLPLWKQRDDKYGSNFSTKKTWLLLRTSRPTCSWSKGIWFPYSTPKYSFLLWVALRNRLQTCDRMQSWTAVINTTCVLCSEEDETRQHLFFGCRYSGQIWRNLVGGILQGSFTTDWNEIIEMVSNPVLSPTMAFLLRYTFQATVHAIWRERNSRRHGEQLQQTSCIIKFVDKTVRLRPLSVKGMGKKYLEEGLAVWFGSRQDQSQS